MNNTVKTFQDFAKNFVRKIPYFGEGNLFSSLSRNVFINWARLSFFEGLFP